MAEMLRGELGPGTWLRQDEIAERLGVSKIPVREALQRLVAKGLLRFEANRGAVVPTLTAEEAEESYALRRAIEPLLLERALPHLSIVDLAEAEVALQADDLSISEANWAFHRALYGPSGWARGLAMAEILHVAVAPYLVLYTEGLGGATSSDAEHVALLKTCRQGKVAAAVEQLLDHLGHAEEALVAYLKSTEQ